MGKNATIITFLFAFSIAIFGYFARQTIHDNLEAVGPHLHATCQMEPLTFTGFAKVDRLLCILDVFFRRAMDDYMGLQVTRVLLGLFGTVQAIMAVEGSRNGYAWYHIMSWFMFWGMLANLVTIAVVTSLLWVPLYVLTSRTFVSRTQTGTDVSGLDDSTVPVMISPARSAGILLSLILAFGIPSVLMTTNSLVERGSWLSVQIITLWQFCPIFIQLSYTVFTWILTPLLKDDRVMPVVAIQDTSIISTKETTTSSSSTTTTRITRESDIIVAEDVNQQRQRVRMAQSKAGVEQLYLILMVLNAMVYYGSFLLTQLDGVHLKESLLLLATHTLPAAGLRDVEIAQFSCAYILFLDLVVLTITLSFWSLYEDGLLAFVFLLVGIPIVGPGTAVATYAFYRENRLQDPNHLKLRTKKTS